MQGIEPAGDEAHDVQAPCPACGLRVAPRRTGGPMLCPNCGHRGSRAWTGPPRRGGRERGPGGGIGLTLSAREREALHRSPTEAGAQVIRVRVRV